MEIKKGIVKSVQSNGNLKLDHGMFYKFEIEIGTDVGEYLSKSQDGGNKNFPIGSEKEYTLEDKGKWGFKIKPYFPKPSFTPQQAFGNNDDRQVMIVKQSSLKVAMDYCIAKEKEFVQLTSVLDTAKVLVDWVMNNSPAGGQINTGIETKTITRKEARNKVADEMENFAEQSGQTMYPKQDDDLPF